MYTKTTPLKSYPVIPYIYTIHIEQIWWENKRGRCIVVENVFNNFCISPERKRSQFQLYR